MLSLVFASNVADLAVVESMTTCKHLADLLNKDPAKPKGVSAVCRKVPTKKVEA